MYGRNLNLEKQEPYCQRPHEEYITAKNGQLKLLLGEIEFLCYVDKNAVKAVVYAGAASGYHIKYLSEMFPHFQFWLFDPRPFSKTLKGCKNVKTFQQFFDENSLELQTVNWAFICDIRTGSDEKSVAADMELQRKWLLHYKPRFSMLKFRLPWSEGKTVYFGGKLRLQAYTGPTSSECRLWISDIADTEWDNIAYQDAVFYFQRRVRTTYHACGFMDGCYDCWAFVKILDKYGKKTFAIKKTHGEFYEWFGFDIMTGAHAVDHSLPHEERLKLIRENAEYFEKEKNNTMEKRSQFFQNRDIKNTEQKYGNAAGEEFKLKKMLTKNIRTCVIISPVAAQYMKKICGLYPVVKFTVYSTNIIPFNCPNMQAIYVKPPEKIVADLIFKSSH